MNELELKYGCNPNQKPSRIFMADGSELPIKVLCGKPGYINFLDAFNGWQLVRELKEATGLPAATSFKHVSPAGAAVGLPLDETMRKIYWVDDMGDLSPLACAYARARGADRMSSFGDFISLSDVCDADTARIIKREVSDGVIAPGYTKEALEILESKKNGKYNVIEIDPDYVPAPVERKQVFGVVFEQGRNELDINKELLNNVVTENKEIPEEAKKELDERFCLIYTGQRRLARNLLRDVIGRYAGNEPDSVFALEEIQKVAALMRFELERGNVDGFAKLLDYHWELSKKVDAGSSNTLIEQIFSSIEELIDGRLVCGAGGGGFLQVVLKKGVTKKQVAERLHEVFMDSLVDVADCKLLWE